jgi:hypothetical protein
MMIHMPVPTVQPAAALRRGYGEMMHNITLFSRLYGEAHLSSGLLFYRRGGDDALIVGYPVGSWSAPLESRVARLMAELADDLDPPASVSYWGPGFPIATLAHLPYRCTSYREHGAANVDVFLDLQTAPTREVAGRRWVRRAMAAGLDHAVFSGRTPTERHDALYQMFLDRHPELTEDDRLYLNGWKSVMREPSTLTVEVTQGGTLTGFALVNVFCEASPTYAYGFFDNAVSGTSDLAYFGMITAAQEIGSRFLDLGYSITPTLLRYKMKWGSCFTCSPPVDATFTLLETGRNAEFSASPSQVRR